MRYLAIISTAEQPQGPSADEVARMEAFLTELLDAGTLITTEGCLPSERGVRVRRELGRTSTTDGPFAEAKEVIGGFALLDVASKDEAIDVSKRFMAIVGDGTCEVRELYPTPPAPVVAAEARRARATVSA